MADSFPSIRTSDNSSIFDIELSVPTHEKRIIDTIKRLQCIRQLIETSQNFQVAARELLEWCSDHRAFTPTFEPYLMECLSAIRKCAQNDGCDVDLSYRVLAICSAHSDQFSNHSAGLLTQWSEELGQVLLLRHKPSHSQQEDNSYGGKTSLEHQRIGPHLSQVSTTVSSMQPGMLQRQYSTGEIAPVGWPAVNGNPAPSPNQSGLSVVATVWGMTPGTQMPPTQHSSGYPDSMNMYQRSAPGQARPTPNGYPQQQPPPFYRQSQLPLSTSPAVTGPHYRPQYKPAPNGNPDYQPPPGALSAAAMVAAAATATATATATASMMVQQDHPHQRYNQQTPAGHHPSQMNPQYVPYNNQQSIRIPSSVNQMMLNREIPSQMSGGQGPMPSQMSGGPGPIPSQSGIVYRRPSPYGNPHQVMMQKRQRYASPSAPPIGMPPSQPYHGSMLPQQQAYHQAVSSQGLTYHSADQVPSNMMLPGSPANGICNSRAPPPYGGNPYHSQVTRGIHPIQQVSSQTIYQNGYTPPMNNMQDVKPQPMPNGGDAKLTFPVRDGMILPPFRLEHNLPCSHHMFYLKEGYFQMLMEKPDLELQLKCFHHEDRQQGANWPATVAVSVNNRSLLIDRGERAYHKPLYLKSVCVPNKNTITISVGACCCSHLFLLQIVHRPTVRSVLLALLRKNLLVGDQCIAKIKRNFANSGVNTDNDSVEQTSVMISLKCPITFRRINLPARGNECCHTQCFDLEAYLQMNADRPVWKCPYCSKNAPLEGLEIDQYMWGILDKLGKTDCEDVSIDANAAWKPNKPIAAKDEDSKADMCSVNNSWMKVYSPSSTNLPSVGSYEAGHNPISPYPTPPNSHNSQGNTSIAQYNGGVYDVGFNSPPDFTGPMSNRSDLSDNDKRMVVLHRQQSGISSPQGASGSATNVVTTNPYNMVGGPGSNATSSSVQASTANMPPGGPPSNGPMSQGPPSNAPPSQGPPSNAPPSHGGPPSNPPASNQSVSANNAAELSADIAEFVQNSSTDNPLEGLDDQDLLAYLGPQDTADSNNENSYNNQSTEPYDDILALLADP